MSANVELDDDAPAETRSGLMPHGPTVNEQVLRSQLQRAQQHLRLWSSVFEQSAEGIMICDARQRIQTVNAAFERVTGYSEMEILGKTPDFLQSGRHDQDFYKNVWRSVIASGCWRGEICNRRKSGELYFEWITIRAVYDYDHNVTQYVGIFSDLTERKQAEASARHLAEYDQLTQLPNRSLLVHRLEQLTAQAHQTQESFALLFVDLDRFKDINESMGYPAGDLLLQTVAGRIGGALRHQDFVARTSADEFVVLVGQLRDPAAAAVIAEALLKSISAPLLLKDQNIVISASIGIALCPRDGINAEQLIRNAAMTVSQSKRDGRNGYRFFTHEVNDRAMERLQIQNALRLALQRDELVLHYQPQVDLASGRMIGVEALVRWNRPGEGMVPPGIFISVAEECGLIAAVDHWVLKRAIQQLKQWDQQGLTGFPVAVNISASEFTQPGFVDGIAQELRLQGVAPARLELELTESIALRDLDAAGRTLQQLHELGVRLSLDDFGTGYCSLSYLSHFPIDKVKIDQSFVRKVDSPQALRIVRGIIALAKSFRMLVIAEGVETQAQLAALRDEHCDEMQGFLVSKALPAEELLQFARGWEGFA